MRSFDLGKTSQEGILFFLSPGLTRRARASCGLCWLARLGLGMGRCQSLCRIRRGRGRSGCPSVVLLHILELVVGRWGL